MNTRGDGGGQASGGADAAPGSAARAGGASLPPTATPDYEQPFGDRRVREIQEDARPPFRGSRAQEEAYRLCVTVLALRARLAEAEDDALSVQFERDGARALQLQAERERDAALALLRDVVGSGVEHDDARIRYVLLQVARVTLEDARALIAGRGGGAT